MTGRELARSGVEGAQLRARHAGGPSPGALSATRAARASGACWPRPGSSSSAATRATVQGGVCLSVDSVVTLPLMLGPGLAGVPATQPDGFIPVDEHGRVVGLADVYAAGDGVDFPVKQGGIAAQQADAVAAHVAARYGAPVAAAPFRPVLRGMLLTGGEPRSPALGRARRRPARLGRLVSAVVAAHEDRRSLPRAVSPGAERAWRASHPPSEGFLDLDIPLTAATLPG